MAKVIVHATMSLDGFIARPNDEINWAFKYARDEMIAEIMTENGAAVMGNRGYISEDSLPYGGQVKVPQFVVTHTPRDPLMIGGLTFAFIDSVGAAIALAKAAAGEKSVTLLGASIDQR